MEPPLEIEIKHERIDIEEHDIMDLVPFPHKAPGLSHLKENAVHMVNTKLIFNDISNHVSVVANRMPLGSNGTLKESNKRNGFMIIKQSFLNKDHLEEIESYLKIKESLLAMKEGKIKLKENMLKVKESNLRMREAKLLENESKAKSKQTKSKEIKKTAVSAKPENKNKPDPVTKSMQKCTICNKMLKYKTWITHMREVHSPTTYVCYCKQFFHAKRAYNRHIQYTHNGVTRYPTVLQQTAEKVECTICDMTFEHAYRLKTHMRNVHSGEGKDIRCDICNSKLKSYSYLNTHMRRVHCDDGKMYTCKICGKSFHSQRYVLIHIKNSHGKHGLKVSSPKKLILEEEQDWSIGNKNCFKETMNGNQKSCEDLQLQNESLDSNDTAKRIHHESKLELDEDAEGYYLKEVMLGPQPNYHVEIRELKLAEM